MGDVERSVWDEPLFHIIFNSLLWRFQVGKRVVFELECFIIDFFGSKRILVALSALLLAPLVLCIFNVWDTVLCFKTVLFLINDRYLGQLQFVDIKRVRVLLESYHIWRDSLRSNFQERLSYVAFVPQTRLHSYDRFILLEHKLSLLHLLRLNHGHFLLVALSRGREVLSQVQVLVE